jgi:sugar phosphate isomerase/epimerase
MPDHMLIPRRQLLKMTGLGAMAMALGVPKLVFAADAPNTSSQTNPGAKAQVMFGVCGRMTNAQMLKDAGCDYIEEKVDGLLMPEKGDEEFAKRLPEISASLLPILNCNSFLPNTLKSVGPDFKLDDVLAYANIAFRRARMVGINVITYGSGGSRRIPDGFSKDQAKQQFIEILKGMGPLAAAQGLKVSIEPLQAKECNFLNNIREVSEVITAANHPNIGITGDLYHMVLGGDVPDDLDRNIHLLHHFHIAEKEKRALPGEAGDDFRSWFAVLAKHGWKGRMSIEAGGGKGDQAAYTKAFAYLRSQAKEAGI